MRHCRKVKEAEAELEKAAAERARFIIDPVEPEDDQQPESSQAAAAAESGAGPSNPGSAPEQATLSSPADESRETPTRTPAEGPVEQREAMQSHAMRVAFDLGIQSTDGAESVDGLDDFEDVLVRPMDLCLAYYSPCFSRSLLSTTAHVCQSTCLHADPLQAQSLTHDACAFILCTQLSAIELLWS